MWDWADPKVYLHDVVATDRRNPTVNANGPLYGSLELSADFLPVLDPAKNTISRVPLTVRDPEHAGDLARTWRSRRCTGARKRSGPARTTCTTRCSTRRDGSGSRRRFGHRPIPAFCREGSDHPSAKLYPIANSGRQLAMYDPATKKLTHINTCFGTHHLMFAEDANQTLWTSGGGQVVGWLNRKMYEETGDEEKSQGWTAIILDTNGNGKRDAYVEPDQPVDPTKDKRYGAAFYAVSPAPDGSVWGSVLGFPGIRHPAESRHATRQKPRWPRSTSRR